MAVPRQKVFVSKRKISSINKPKARLLFCDKEKHEVFFKKGVKVCLSCLRASLSKAE